MPELRSRSVNWHKLTPLLALLYFAVSANAVAQELPAWALEPVEEEGSLSVEVEELKDTLLNLNRDLLVLEEELLFPANTQIALFLSMDVGEFFQLDSVKLEVDGDLVASHLYTERQIDALHRGGVQRLHIGNLKSGAHEITAFFTGKGPQAREYKRGTSLEIEKTQDPLLLELIIRDSERKQQPEFSIKEWDI